MPPDAPSAGPQAGDPQNASPEAASLGEGYPHDFLDTAHEKTDADAEEQKNASDADAEKTSEKEQMEKIAANINQLFAMIGELFRQKFFPGTRGRKVDVAAAKGLAEDEAAQKDPDKPEETAKEKAETNTALKTRAADTAQQMKEAYGHESKKARPPRGGEIRPFYERDENGAMIQVRREFNSSTGQFEKEVSRRSVADIRKEVFEKHARDKAAREVEKVSDPEGDRIFAMWRSGRYSGYLRDRANRRAAERIMNEGKSGDAWRELDRRERDLAQNKLPPIDETVAYTNYRVNPNPRAEAERIVKESVEGPITPEQRAEGERILRENNLFTQESYERYAREQWNNETQGKVALTFDQMEKVNPRFGPDGVMRQEGGPQFVNETERFVRENGLDRYIVDEKNNSVVFYKENGQSAVFLDAKGNEIERIVNPLGAIVSPDFLRRRLQEKSKERTEPPSSPLNPGADRFDNVA